MPGQVNPLDFVIATVHPVGTVTPEHDVALLTATPSRGGRPRILVEDVVRDDHALRHDPEKLAAVLMRLYEQERRARSVNGAVRAAL
jgi:hypothetical protein